MTQSSAKIAVLSGEVSPFFSFSLALSAVVMSLIKILNSVGKITEPCGMPFIILVLSENCPLTRIAMERLWIKLLIKLNIFPLIPLLSNLFNSPWRLSDVNEAGEYCSTFLKSVLNRILTS